MKLFINIPQRRWACILRKSDQNNPTFSAVAQQARIAIIKYFTNWKNPPEHIPLETFKCSTQPWTRNYFYSHWYKEILLLVIKLIKILCNYSRVTLTSEQNCMASMQIGKAEENRKPKARKVKHPFNLASLLKWGTEVHLEWLSIRLNQNIS